MRELIRCSQDVDLAKIVEEKSPLRLCALGASAANSFTPYLKHQPKAELVHIADGDWLAAMAAGQRYDFVYLAEVLEHMSKAQAGQLLTKLRDCCQFLYARVPIGKAWLNHVSLWEQKDLRGLGFDLVNLSAERGRPMGLFCYDSSAFRSESEWRNSKYWAQPD